MYKNMDDYKKSQGILFGGVQEKDLNLDGIDKNDIKKIYTGSSMPANLPTSHSTPLSKMASTSSVEHVLSFKDEKDIQVAMKTFLEREKFGTIEEEFHLGRRPDLQKHQYILLDEFLKYVEILNADLWNNQKYRENKEKIIELIKQDFLGKFDSYKNNVDIYNLIFGVGARIITLTKIDGSKDTTVTYRVIDTDYNKDCRNNNLTIIREKAVRIHPASEEYQIPDFAIYLNGIPFIAVEVKNPTNNTGVYEALRDYRAKTTYHKFLSCLCVDNLYAGLVTSPNSMTVDYWKNYGKHKETKYKGYNWGFIDFANELLFNVKNFVFYFQFGVFKKINGLANLRVQQYFALKKSYEILKRRYFQGVLERETFREVVKHPPRTGKTITIRSIINMVCSLFPDQFEKIFIQVPDLNIKGQFADDFKSFTFGNGYSVKPITRRKKSTTKTELDMDDISYEEAISQNSKHIYIMNMQKISEDFIGLVNNNPRILVFVDEVHTHQTGENAKSRDINFPNASYFTFTATDRRKEEGDILKNITMMEYSTSGEYLDEFNNEDAKNFNLVIPVVYEKAKYNACLNDANAKLFNDHIQQDIEGKLHNDPKFTSIKDDIEEKVIEYFEDQYEKKFNKPLNFVCHTLSDVIQENAKYPQLQDLVTKFMESQVNKFVQGGVSKIKAETLYKVKEQIIPDKIGFVLRDLKEKTKDNYSEKDPVTGEVIKQYFKTKAFWIVDDQRTANEIVRVISQMSNKTNTIDGIRFGLDYSDNVVNSNNKNLIHDFNINKNGNTVKDDFDSQNDNSLDVLIIVGKYLMGYDNKQLVAVYCDTTIQEPSRIFQIYTRPATKFENKNLGFFVDLSFDSQNYDTYKRALAWYEEGQTSSLMFIDETKIEQLLSDLEHWLTKLALVLKLKKEDLLTKAKERDLFITNTTQIEKNSILDICKNINTVIRNLISPKYYRDYLAYILVINKALWGLLNYLKASQKQVVWTAGDIEVLFNDFLKVLNFQSVTDIIDIDLDGNKFVKNTDVAPAKETVISKQIYSVKKLLDTNKDYVEPDIFSKLRFVVDQIEASNKWDEATAKKSKEMFDEATTKINAIDEIIKNDFNNNMEWFVTFKILGNYLEINGVEIESKKDKFKVFCEKLSSGINDKIKINLVNNQLAMETGLFESVRSIFSSVVTQFVSQDNKFFKSIYDTIAKDTQKEKGLEISEMLLKQIYSKKYKHV